VGKTGQKPGFVCFLHSNERNGDGFAPRAEPPAGQIDDRSRAFGTDTLREAPGASLIFSNLMTLVTADSDLTSLQKENSLKEVIQPHLPVRLPCYDFTPLTGHSFGASVPHGFGQRLREQQIQVM
jgi:hypothetical protein